MNNIKITNIEIKGLFNHFNYDISIPEDDKVGILTAPNGCGKTTIFRLIDFIFNPSINKYREISTIPFDYFRVVFSDGRDIIIKNKAGKEGATTNMTITFFGDKKNAVTLSDVFDEALFVDEDDRSPYRNTEEIDKMPIRKFLESDNMPRYLRRRINFGNDNPVIKYAKLIEEHLPSNSLLFIPADRMHTHISDEYLSLREMRFGEREDTLSDIIRASRAVMQKMLDEYNTLVEKARDELPEKFLTNKTNSQVSYQEFYERWEKYLSRLKEFESFGVVNGQKIIEINEKMYESKKEFLNAYLDAFEKTIEPLNEYYDKMLRLTEIFNTRNKVTHKQLKFTRYGLVVETAGVKHELNTLSSGEKNDLVMFYYLIFKAQEGDMLLIDEPEISLHISWQEDYVNQLLSICEINNLQAIIATHSPTIVDGHEDLVLRKDLTDDWAED